MIEQKYANLRTDRSATGMKWIIKESVVHIKLMHGEMRSVLLSICNGLGYAKVPFVHFTAREMLILQKHRQNPYNDMYTWQVPPELSVINNK